MENGPDRVYGFPEEKHEDSAERHDVENLHFGVVILDHRDIERTEYGDAVDGDMWGGDEEAGGGGYDDGDEGCCLLSEGDEGVDQGEGVGEEGDGYYQVGASADFGPDWLLLLKILISHQMIRLFIKSSIYVAGTLSIYPQWWPVEALVGTWTLRLKITSLWC